MAVGDDSRAALRAMVSGDVQGVGFRWWTQRRAESLGLSGSAVNLADGRVEIVAEGPRDRVEQLLVALNGGSTPGSVRYVEHEWITPEGVSYRFHTG